MEQNKEENEKIKNSISSSSSYIPEIEFEKNVMLDKSQSEKINDQMTYSICKILKINKSCGTGFFCLVPLSSNNKEKTLRALITNNHVLDIDDIAPDKKIRITVNDCSYSKIIVINSNRKVYTNEEYDITIIEIKDSDNLNYIKYLEIDDRVFLNNIEKNYKKAYVLHYPGQITKVSSSFGEMDISVDYNGIQHKCSTTSGSSGSPILELSTFKVMGIHKGSRNKINLGTFLRKPIEQFINYDKEEILNNYARLKHIVNQNKKIKSKKEPSNEIKIRLKAQKNDIGQKVYFLGNSEENKNNTELNNTNVKIYIDNNKLNTYQKYFEPEIDKEYDIRIEFDIKMKDCSYMFFNCPNIIKLDLSSFDTSKVYNMNHMFGRCYNVNEIDVSGFNTENVKDMGYLFSKCKKLINLDLSIFETEKVENMSCMFYENFSITQIYLPFFNTEKVKDMSCMFCRCYKLEKLDLKSFNTKNVLDMSHMFDECINLKEIGTTSSFSTENTNNLCHMFRRCNNLLKMELTLNSKNVKYLSFMFYDCFNLTNVDVSKLKTGNVKDMTYMFSGCNNLSEIDLSSFTFENIVKMNDMFDECTNLKSIKVNKDWKDKIKSENENVKNIIF